MLDSPATKAELRAVGLTRRAALSEDEREAAARSAVARLRPLLREGETVSLYWPMRNEIDPRALIDDVRAAGGNVTLPAVEKGSMVFRMFNDESGLEDGPFGTRHPSAAHPILDPDLIVAPLAAFDRNGGRIGYGAGHYDRAVAALKAGEHAFRIVGIAFACQEVESIPVEPHDVCLGAVATECELINMEAA